mmetsp:Transcript_3774/g.8046  ORF Transcript_3774/g.8046 Transcript_3774/m.8046 type:complete len:238 (-) Transcript_3774:2185-2898(-)
MICILVGLLATSQATYLRQWADADFSFQEINYLKANLKSEKDKIAEVKAEQDQIGRDMDDLIERELAGLEERHSQELDKLKKKQDQEGQQLNALIQEQIEGVNEEFEVTEAELATRQARIQDLNGQLKKTYHKALEDAEAETEAKKKDLEAMEKYKSYLTNQIDSDSADQDEADEAGSEDDDSTNEASREEPEPSQSESDDDEQQHEDSEDDVEETTVSRKKTVTRFDGDDDSEGSD